MGAVVSKAELVPPDLDCPADDKDIELIGGKVVERAMGFLSSWGGGNLLRL